jgi:predicted enzyme related to lactoylglutathione lyase
MAPDPIVHLELLTGDRAGAGDFYRRLLGWQPGRVDAAGAPYWTLGMPGGTGGGIVESTTNRPLWLPYVEVGDIGAATERAGGLGARVALAPREGPCGWRSVVCAPAGGPIAFWQPKGRAGG